VGVLVAAGENRLPVERIRELLDERKRTADVQTAPAQGLFLMKVFYPPASRRSSALVEAAATSATEPADTRPGDE